MFLLQKVKLVSKFSRDRVFNLLLWGTQMALVVFIPGCVIMYGFVLEGKVTNEGRCIQLLPPWTFWAFSGANLVLSGVLIYLFAWPLRRMVNTGLSTVQHELRRLYWRNLLASSFAVVFTSAVVITYGVMQQLSLDRKEDEHAVLGLLIMSWDAIVLSACCRLTTFVWLPGRVRRMGAKPPPPPEEEEEVEEGEEKEEEKAEAENEPAPQVAGNEPAQQVAEV